LDPDTGKPQCAAGAFAALHLRLQTNAGETLRENWQLRRQIVMLRRKLISIAAMRKSAELYDLFLFE
jgi:hypothetical protein